MFSLVREQLGAFSETARDQSEITGHNAFLKPNAVQYVGLALHELIAHSLLSGALARPDGGVEVDSRVETNGEGTPMLVLSWRERVEQLVLRDMSTEFGEALLTTIVPAALGGSAELEQGEDGAFLYALRIPSSAVLLKASGIKEPAGAGRRPVEILGDSGDYWRESQPSTWVVALSFA